MYKGELNGSATPTAKRHWLTQVFNPQYDRQTIQIVCYRWRGTAHWNTHCEGD
jgi:hypothetical protein